MAQKSKLLSEPRMGTEVVTTTALTVGALIPRQPTLVVTILSATAQQQFVRPGGSVTITVSGTVTVSLPGVTPVGSPTVEVTFAGGATQTVGVASDGSWSCTGNATGSATGIFTNTAYGSAQYSYKDPETGNTVTETVAGTATVDVPVTLDSAPPVVTFSAQNGPTY